jgi:hypothetical protein
LVAALREQTLECEACDRIVIDDEDFHIEFALLTWACKYLQLFGSSVPSVTAHL